MPNPFALRRNNSLYSSIRIRSAKMLFALLAPILLFSNGVVAAISCSDTPECESKLRPGSTCTNGFCTNPLIHGCLHHELQYGSYLDTDMEKTKKAELLKSLVQDVRICNSDDAPHLLDNGVCKMKDAIFNYTELRIAPNDWESPIFITWVIQIILSEILGVPVSIESGSKEKAGQSKFLNFYDLNNSFFFPPNNAFSSLHEANMHGGECTGKAEKPCAHFMPEVWVTPPEDFKNNVTVQANGMATRLGIYTSKYTVEKYPSFAGYVGLRNRTE